MNCNVTAGAQHSLTVSAPAKVNWTLDILQKRPDGYHEIATIMQAISLYDELTITRISTGIELEITGPCAAGVPADASNLVLQAANLLGADGVHISLSKHIPSQAGLGGGSSDAASALLAINRLLDLGFSKAECRVMATKLGSDVLFFTLGHPARVTGTGDRIDSVVVEHARHLVLIKPNCGVSTRAAYDALDKLPDRVPGNATELWDGNSMSNDFEAVIFDLYPEIAAARAALHSAGIGKTLLCGSGSTVMGVLDDAGLDEIGRVDNSMCASSHERVAHLVRQNVGAVWTATTIL